MFKILKITNRSLQACVTKMKFENSRFDYLGCLLYSTPFNLPIERYHMHMDPHSDVKGESKKARYPRVR